MSATTWDLMQKYNLPVPGAKIRVLSHLDTYVRVGDVLNVGWSKNSVDSYVHDEKGGCAVRLWQFKDCQWEYVYDDKPELKWPRP